MKLPAFEYIEPQSISEACRVLAEKNGNAQIIAGGTELLSAMKNRLTLPKVLVSLERIPDMAVIRYSADSGLILGPLVSLRRLTTHLQIQQKYSLVAAAAQAVGSIQIQAMGTVGGNLCQDCCCIYYNRPPMLRKGWDPCYKLGGEVCHAVKRSPDCWAAYSGDLAPSLLALQAEVTLAGSTTEKTIPLQHMYSGDSARPLILAPGQMLKKIHLPDWGTQAGGAYLKLSIRKAIDYPLLGVAAAVALEEDGETCRYAGVALTGIGAAPVSITESGLLQGQSISDAIIDQVAEVAYGKARPVANAIGYSPRYRREMVRVYVKLAIKKALTEAKTQGGPK
jgi:4-hydroxybenzoyl-CoA reductase subunit beta